VSDGVDVSQIGIGGALTKLFLIVLFLQHYKLILF
jgi:hypothetical protein